MPDLNSNHTILSLMIKQGKGFRTVRVIIASFKIIKHYYWVQKYLGTNSTVSKLGDCIIPCT